MVYFVQGELANRVKIGRAKDVLRRLQALQAASPDRLTVLAVILNENDDRVYHARFAGSWSHGEWFTSTPDLMDFIDRVPQSEFTGICLQIQNRGVIHGVMNDRSTISRSERLIHRARIRLAKLKRESRWQSETEAALQVPFRPGSIEQLRHELACELMRDGEIEVAHGVITGLDDDYVRETIGV